MARFTLAFSRITSLSRRSLRLRSAFSIFSWRRSGLTGGGIALRRSWRAEVSIEIVGGRVLTIGCSRLGRIEANRGATCPVGGYLRTHLENSGMRRSHHYIGQSYSTRVSITRPEHVVRVLHYPLTISRVTRRATCHVPRCRGSPQSHRGVARPAILTPRAARSVQRAEAAHTHCAGPAVYLPPGAVQSSPR